MDLCQYLCVTERYTYLGVEISSNGRYLDAIDVRMASGKHNVHDTKFSENSVDLENFQPPLDLKSLIVKYFRSRCMDVKYGVLDTLRELMYL